MTKVRENRQRAPLTIEEEPTRALGVAPRELEIPGARAGQRYRTKKEG